MLIVSNGMTSVLHGKQQKREVKVTYMDVHNWNRISLWKRMSSECQELQRKPYGNRKLRVDDNIDSLYGFPN